MNAQDRRRARREFLKLMVGRMLPEGRRTPTLHLSRKELEELREYSLTVPTGTTEGKRWKANARPAYQAMFRTRSSREDRRTLKDRRKEGVKILVEVDRRMREERRKGTSVLPSGRRWTWGRQRWPTWAGDLWFVGVYLKAEGTHAPIQWYVVKLKENR